MDAHDLPVPPAPGRAGGPPRPRLPSIGAVAEDHAPAAEIPSSPEARLPPPPPEPPRSPEPRIPLGRRALIAGLAVVAAALLLGVGVVLKDRRSSGSQEAIATTPVAPIPEIDQTPSEPTPAETTPEPEPEPATSGQTATSAAFTMTVPSGWVRDSRDEDHSGVFVESHWHEPGSPDVELLVDYTAGFDGTPASGARGVRDQVQNASSYREITFTGVTLAGRSAWKWEFMLGGVHKVDYFMTACGTGFAMLGAAPPSRFADYADAFTTAARSLQPTC